MERNEYVGSDSWPPKETTSDNSILSRTFRDPSVKCKNTGVSGQLDYEYNPCRSLSQHWRNNPWRQELVPQGKMPMQTATISLYLKMDVTDQPLTLLGPITATLWLSSDVRCTDFIVGIAGCSSLTAR